ncbi:uncharacterized protein N7482_000837 [Penicillium canariense]|uniref:Uncharacterized protein n=1 Tax=Penicillium canariense TaxID=189055 RepID=A0A9W9ICR7_9EURO|nr:uncharacterized protein N7482_000837 [Penicillium canariense]KAJ5174960.1 hypothetical protein N7482_000837 [Penicillium canariense]
MTAEQSGPRTSYPNSLPLRRAERSKPRAATATTGKRKPDKRGKSAFQGSRVFFSRIWSAYTPHCPKRGGWGFIPGGSLDSADVVSVQESRQPEPDSGSLRRPVGGRIPRTRNPSDEQSAGTESEARGGRVSTMIWWRAELAGSLR